MRMKKRTWARLAFGALLAAGATDACLPPTQVTLTLTTDIPCDELRGASITVGTPAELETIDASTDAVTCKDGTLGTIVLVPHGDRSAEFGVKVVASRNVALEQCNAATGYGKALTPSDDPNKPVGCIVARRALTFIQHRPLNLSVALRSVCTGNPCDANTTCIEGTCVDATCPEGEDCSDATFAAPTPVHKALSVAAGHDESGKSHSCAVLDDHTVWCWGDNSHGELGLPTVKLASSTVPVKVPAIAGATQIAAGLGYSCALVEDGTVWCWGLGFGDSANAPAPLLPLKSGPVVRLSAAENMVCGAQTGTGFPFTCWTGSDPSKRLGRPLLLAPLDFGAGDRRACFIGGNTAQCARVDMQGSLETFGIVGTKPDASAYRLAVGRTHASTSAEAFLLVLSTSLTGDFIAGRGADEFGQLGAPAPPPGTTVVLSQNVNAAGIPRSVYAGGTFACADIEPKGIVPSVFHCWGDGSLGKLGAPRLSSQLPSEPLAVVGLPPGAVKSAGLGQAHSCVVASDERVYCWGCGASGQLGDGTSAASCAEHFVDHAVLVEHLGD